LEEKHTFTYRLRDLNLGKYPVLNEVLASFKARLRKGYATLGFTTQIDITQLLSDNSVRGWIVLIHDLHALPNYLHHHRIEPLIDPNDPNELQRAIEHLLSRTESKDRFELAATHASDGIWDWDLKTNFLYLSPRWKEMLGFKDHELENHFSTFTTLIHPEDYNHVMQEAERKLNDPKREFSIQFRIRTKQGNYRHVLSKGNTILDEQGEAIRFVGFHTDIHELLRTTEDLLHKERRFKAIAKSASDFLYEWDIEHNTLMWFGDLHHALGYSPNHVEPTLEAWLELIHPDDAPELKRLIDRHAVLGGQLEVAYRIKHADGSWRHWNDKGTTLNRSDGTPYALVGGCTDITELETYRNHLEERVQHEIAKNREQEHMLIQQSKLAALGDMLVAVAHHWRQPLTTLSLILQDLPDAFEIGELDHDYLMNVVDESMDHIRHLSNTIDEFSAFFKGSGHHTDISVMGALHAVRSLYNTPALNAYIAIEIKGDDFTLHGDANAFRQVLLNLITNAIDILTQQHEKSAKTGTIWIHIDADSQRIVITDSGGGIAESELFRVFDPYFTTKKSGSGHGMGLYIAQMIIQHQFQGKIDVENTNQGARFTLAL